MRNLKKKINYYLRKNLLMKKINYLVTCDYQYISNYVFNMKKNSDFHYENISIVKIVNE